MFQSIILVHFRNKLRQVLRSSLTPMKWGRPPASHFRTCDRSIVIRYRIPISRGDRRPRARNNRTIRRVFYPLQSRNTHCARPRFAQKGKMTNAKNPGRVTTPRRAASSLFSPITLHTAFTDRPRGEKLTGGSIRATVAKQQTHWT